MTYRCDRETELVSVRDRPQTSQEQDEERGSLVKAASAVHVLGDPLIPSVFLDK